VYAPGSVAIALTNVPTLVCDVRTCETEVTEGKRNSVVNGGLIFSNNLCIMENIQDEEERPLTSPKRRVAEAYKTPANNNPLKKYICVSIFALILLLAIGSSDGDTDSKKRKRAQKLRNRAENAPEQIVQKQAELNQQADAEEIYESLNDTFDVEDSMVIDELAAENELEVRVEEVHYEVELEEEDAVEANSGVLQTAIKSVDENVRFYLKRVMGGGSEEDDDDDDEFSSSADISLSEEQLDKIAQKISEKLESKVKDQFREKADNIADEKNQSIQEIVEEDHNNSRLSARQIADDLHEAEQVAVSDMKEEIEDAAGKVADSIPELAQRIRDEVVEEETGKRLEDIKQRKQARRDRKKALRQKFQELQAKNKLKLEQPESEIRLSDSSGVNFNTSSKAKENARERQPLEKIKNTPANEEGLRSEPAMETPSQQLKPSSEGGIEESRDQVSKSGSSSEGIGIEDEVDAKVDAKDDAKDDVEEENGSVSKDDDDEVENGSGSEDVEDLEDAW